MNCRNCSAVMSPVGGAAYFRCQHCGTFEFPTTTDDGVAEHGEVSRFACPVCTHALSTASIEGHSISYCGTCRGFLTTNAEFSEILTRRRVQAAEKGAVPRTIDPAELKRSVGCPRCRKRMDAHPFGGGGNVVVDTCHRCHLIWLDAGELEVLARHRPRVGVTGLAPVVLVPQFDGPPREPESPWRWGSSHEPGWELSGDDVLRDLFRRLF